MAQVSTINDLLDGHVALDVECLDRIYLNAYVPTLQTNGQVVSFLVHHRQQPMFAKDARKIEAIKPYFEAAKQRARALGRATDRVLS